MATCSSQGKLIISEVVYAELLVPFLRGQIDLKLKTFLDETNISLVNTSEVGCQETAKAWNKYISHRKITQKIMCSQCGHQKQFICEKCREQINWRNHIITDFLVGGHALENANRLLTRDRGFYQKYFQNLKVLDPRTLGQD